MSNSMASTASAVGISRAERKVILASSLGTIFEWYDFFLYGALAAIIGKQFFTGVNDTTAFIFALMTFAAGFVVRPFGALVFGRLGDMIGRKYTFLATIVIMGLSTFLVGVLPGYATLGIAAPIALVSLRMLQGLAIGGEYGGAAIYVAEHAPDHKRGGYTSWIQVTAGVGLLLSLLVILACRKLTGDAFNEWGWRLPFLISIVLLAISTWIRLSMEESPAFLKMKEEGKHSKAPISEAFGNWRNLKVVLIALFGFNGGQAVTFYCAQFYSLFFLTQILKVDPQTANLMLIASLILTTPLFMYFGHLSDRVGRKPVLIVGLALALALTFPAFRWMTAYANPDVADAQVRAPVTVVSDPSVCHFQFDPIGKAKLNSPCDQAKALLAKDGVPYQQKAAAVGVTEVHIGDAVLTSFDKKTLQDALKAAGYPDKADPDKINHAMVILILVMLSTIAALTYGPLAAMMVELFPTRIRYTSMSLPYHLGNGWIGGLMPTVAFSLVVYTGDILYGLWYPIVVYAVSLIVSLLFLKETFRNDIHQH
ncbi:MFS transporter [Chromobacterium phragmitis]|uniref:MFS transporter n=1 Tax=Chromobacterium phragmitis TaxID=2202141 RepID=A0A344UM10_9NEIS|nr:MFS transporter [Chromobacterium phragmitis]AXE30911.1 MFS transporter [Chromobacterium phragmitis]AXE36308.1 MFS transporter [Chromobacterium phragmitis]